MGPDDCDPFGGVDSDVLTRRAFKKGVVVGCGLAFAIPAALGILGAIVLAVLMVTGHIPDTAAIPGPELAPSTLDFLSREGLIEESERVLYFYSDGFLSLREDGNFFTDRRAVSYWETGDKIQTEVAGYHEIDALSFEPDSGLFANSVITIDRVDESTFQLVVSNEGGNDAEFWELLNRTWNQRRNGGPARRGKELGDEVLEFLRRENIVSQNEEVLFFYAKTSGSLRADGNLFTDRRAISYWEFEDEIVTREVLYPQITGIEAGWGEGRHNVTTVTIELVEGDPLTLWVSQEDEGDRAFVQSLIETWEAQR